MLGYWLTPADAGSKFRSLTRAISPLNRLLAHKEGAGSKTVLMMQSIVKSLGHMWHRHTCISEDVSPNENLQRYEVQGRKYEDLKSGGIYHIQHLDKSCAL